MYTSNHWAATAGGGGSMAHQIGGKEEGLLCVGVSVLRTLETFPLQAIEDGLGCIVFVINPTPFVSPSIDPVDVK